MTSPIERITVAAAVIGASGGGVLLLGAARARWNLRAETIRNGRERRENELHRGRLAEVWHQWHDLPGGDERVQAARWYTEWTGTVPARRGGIDSGGQPPGFGCRDAEEAYDRYIQFLGYRYDSAPQSAQPRRRLGLRRAITGHSRQAAEAGAKAPTLPGATGES